MQLPAIAAPAFGACGPSCPQHESSEMCSGAAGLLIRRTIRGETDRNDHAAGRTSSRHLVTARATAKSAAPRSWQPGGVKARRVQHVRLGTVRRRQVAVDQQLELGRSRVLGVATAVGVAGGQPGRELVDPLGVAVLVRPEAGTVTYQHLAGAGSGVPAAQLSRVPRAPALNAAVSAFAVCDERDVVVVAVHRVVGAGDAGIDVQPDVQPPHGAGGGVDDELDGHLPQAGQGRTAATPSSSLNSGVGHGLQQPEQ
jgi:hypothetical protein